MKKSYIRFFILTALFLMVLPHFSSHAFDELVATGSMTMRVDEQKRARAGFAGIPVIPSILGRLEIYERNLSGTRQRLAVGPWRKSTIPYSLTKKTKNNYLLTGNNYSTGSSFRIYYEQVNENAIKVSGEITAPHDSTFPCVEYEILKIPAELFTGASVKAEPGKGRSILPVEPRPLAKRYLYKKKNLIHIDGALCTIRIKDLTGQNSIYAADFRNTPFDRLKSFYFYSNKKMFTNGKKISFSYLIEILPPKDAPKSHSPLIYNKSCDFVNFWKTFKPVPKYYQKKSGYFRIQSTNNIISNGNNKVAQILSDALKELTGKSFTIAESNISSAKGIFINLSKKAGNGKSLPEEGYEIIVDENTIQINGSCLRGTLYGVYSALGMVFEDNQEWIIPCTVERDWPELPVRAFCTELLFPAIRDVDLFKRYIDVLSYARANTIIFYFYPAHLLDWKNKKDNGRFTTAQIKEVADHARSMGMDVWSGMVSRFDRKKYPELKMVPKTEFFNPLEESAYNYLESLYDEAIFATNPDLFIIAHDEIQGLSEYSNISGKKNAELFALSVRTIQKFLAKKGIRTALWGDMLLDGASKDFRLNANSNSPVYNSGSTHLAIDQIPKDVVILDWHYMYRDIYRSINYFAKKGFEVYGCSWFLPRAAKKMVETVVESNEKGIVGSDWGFWATLSPSATTITTTLYGWNKDYQLSDDADLEAFSQSIKPQIRKRKWSSQEPVSISSSLNSSYCKTAQSYKKNGFICNLGMCSLPQRLTTKDNIEYKITDSCILVDSKKISNITIPLDGKKAKALAFLNTACIEEPVYRIRDLGHYIIEYTDGKKETLIIKEGWNLTDFKSIPGLRLNSWSFSRKPEIILGADLAFEGISVQGLPYNLQSTIWPNPNPQKKIKSLTIVSNKSSHNWGIIVLGVTILE